MAAEADMGPVGVSYKNQIEDSELGCIYLGMLGLIMASCGWRDQKLSQEGRTGITNLVRRDGRPVTVSRVSIRAR